MSKLKYKKLIKKLSNKECFQIENLNLDQLRITKLKEIAKEKGIKNYQTYTTDTRQELINLIINTPDKPTKKLTKIQENTLQNEKFFIKVWEELINDPKYSKYNHYFK